MCQEIVATLERWPWLGGEVNTLIVAGSNGKDLWPYWKVWALLRVATKRGSTVFLFRTDGIHSEAAMWQAASTGISSGGRPRQHCTGVGHSGSHGLRITGVKP